MKPFLSDDFLLHTDTAKDLYHSFAKPMPIFDYHCHLPIKEIAKNINFENPTQIWLKGDHYKWRAMRANGIDERLITGNSSDYEKFEAWAATVPKTLCNPLYHWTHMELKDPFGIKDQLLNPETAREIYDTCSQKLQTADFSPRGILEKMNVKVVCTTDDPIDSLEHHQKLRDDEGFSVKVLPAFRPDKAMAVELKPDVYNKWVDSLEAVSDIEINTYSSFFDAIRQRHDVFHEMGCRISDHGVERFYAEDFTQQEIARIFEKIRSNNTLENDEILKFKSAVLIDLAVLNAEKGWTQQFHFGALRNTNSRMNALIGVDTGFDSIGDFENAASLAKYLDRLDVNGNLAKTILYNLNPGDNEMVASMIGNFQDGSVPGKMQFGAGWWFNDQKDGILRHFKSLANLGLISRFVGMLTDSRSFLSYSRHDYFRRILCNYLGTDIENGELPHDIKLVGGMVQDICYDNAVDYFGIEV